MNDCQADIIEMRLDEMKDVLDQTYECVGCPDKSCRDCEVSRNRREALSDEDM